MAEKQTAEERFYKAIRGKPSKRGQRTPKRIARALAKAMADNPLLANATITRVKRRFGGRVS